MFKRSILGLVMGSALIGSAQAYVFSDGEQRLFNFSATLSGTSNRMDLAGSILFTNNSSWNVEFFDGLNLTGGSLGSYRIPHDHDYVQLAGVLDGVFSMRLTANGAFSAWNDSDTVGVIWFDTTTYSEVGSAFGTDAQDLQNPTPDPTPGGTVPEPGSALLVALAGLALLTSRRRGRAQNAV